MSSYNVGSFLQESVEAILRQSFDDFEFVIVNDGSTDDSAAYLDSLDDPRVRVIHQDNRGLGRPQNELLRSCQGKYIMRMDADDSCDASRMEKQLAVLQADPDKVMVGCFFQCFANGKSLPASPLPTTHESIVGGMLRGWHTMSHATIMFRRSLLDQIEGYVIAGAGEDWTFLLDAARIGKLAMVPEPLYQVRIHPGSSAWNGAENVVLGFRFAQQRHLQFLESQTNLTHEEFMANWKQASTFTKIKVRLATHSCVLHRQAVLDRINNKYASATARTLAAGLLNPSKSIGAIWKRLNNNRRSG